MNDALTLCTKRLSTSMEKVERGFFSHQGKGFSVTAVIALGMNSAGDAGLSRRHGDGAASAWPSWRACAWPVMESG